MSAPQIKWLSRDDPPAAFPDIRSALAVPDGLLAAGGDLNPERLLSAYERAIFPWYEQGQPILWWSPDPRCVLPPDEFHAARRLRRSLRRSEFRISFNRSFHRVMAACGEPRDLHRGTWITGDMRTAYGLLHEEGWAHSVEVWLDGRLVGGIYGLAIGHVFFGESMFSRTTNASKAAMFALCRELASAGFELLDCQLVSPHLLTLGATTMPRSEFAHLLRRACEPRRRYTAWPDALLPAASLVS